MAEAISSILMIILIALSIGELKDKYEVSFSKYILGVAIFIVILFLFSVYPDAEPYVEKIVTTNVKDEWGNEYTAKVEISVDREYKDVIVKAEVETIPQKVYRPMTIYWPEGGYTILDKDESEIATKKETFVTAYAENSDKRYRILIPQITFSAIEKLEAIGILYLLLFLCSEGLGVAAIFIHAKKSLR